MKLYKKICDHNFNNMKFLNEFKTDLFLEKVTKKTIIYYNFLMLNVFVS